MDNLIFSLNATIPVFLMMVLGYILKRLKAVDEPFVQTLNSFNFKITLPVLLFRDIAESDFSAMWDTRYVLYCFFVTLFCIAAIWGGTALFYFIRRAFHSRCGSFPQTTPGPNENVNTGEFVQASFRGSAAVLGVAFIQNIYGDSGMAPLMIIGTVPLYNIAAVLILSFTRPDIGKLDKKTFLSALRGIVTNPIIIGIALGMAVSAAHIRFPSMIQKTVSSISSLATPLALIGLGAGFEGKKALKLLKPTFASSAIKLLLQPALFLPLAVRLGFTDAKLVAILIMLGAPTTVSCYIMAKNMGHDGTLTSSVVVMTTFLSAVTITLWLFILRSLALI